MEAVVQLGQWSLMAIWLPVIGWTVCAGIGLFWIRSRRTLHPLFRYRLGQALLFALPATLLVAPAMSIGTFPVPHLSAVGAPVQVSSSGPATHSSPAERREAPVAEAQPPVGSARSQLSGREGTATPSVPRDTRAGSRSMPVRDALSLAVGLATIGAVMLALAQLVLILSRLGRLEKLARTAVKATEPSALALLAKLRDEVGVRGPVALLQGPADSVPITFGWLTTAIVVPRGMIGRREQLRMSLLHELVHVRRNDFVWGVCERVTCAVFAFHPLTWALSRGIDRDREASCDAEVVGAGHATPRAYANLLYALAGHSKAHLGVAAALATSPSHLRERIETMKTFLNRPTERHLPLRSATAALTVLVSTTLLGACMGGGEAPPDSEEDHAILVYDRDTGRPISEDALEREITKLDVQIAYLERELDEIRSRVDEAAVDYGGWSRRDRTRYALLTEMYEGRWRKLETLNLEAAAAEATR